MSIWRNLSLNIKIFTVNAIITLVFFIIVLSFTPAFIDMAVDKITDDKLQPLIHVVTDSISSTAKQYDNNKKASLEAILTKHLKSINLGEDEYISIVDKKNGRLLLHKESVDNQYSWISSIINKDSGFFVYENSKKQQIAARFVKLNKPEWIIVVSTSVKSVESIMQNIAFYVALFFLLILTIFGTVIRNLVKRLIIKPVQQLIEVLNQGVEGDLEIKTDNYREDEIGILFQKFNDFVVSLRSIVGSISRTSETVLTSSNEISQGNNQLSSATQQMASSLEETAASVEEITSSIHDTAEISGNLTRSVEKTAKGAEKGEKTLQKMVNAISKVGESGERISEIVDVVNAIAHQTNLLALNAAVEAARAGEQGKGFAVVASEVRSLAQRSGEAASEIKELVEDNEENIASASDISQKTSKILMDVVNSIQKNALEMKDIEKRATEQSHGISQINTAILQMEEVTQRNAALVQELASSAMDMSMLSKNLTNEIEKFHVKESKLASLKEFQKSSVHDYTPPLVKPSHVNVDNNANFDDSEQFVEFDEEDVQNITPPTVHSKNTSPEAAFLDDDQFEEF